MLFGDEDMSRWYQIFGADLFKYYPGFDRYCERVQDEAFESLLERLGSPDVLPAVRAIEAIIHVLQQSSSFCMHVNGCENCHVKFAQYLSHDGKGEDTPYDGKTYGQYTCMLCGDARFSCLDCVGYSYHYCFEWGCEACVCVKCDGGRSPKGENELGGLAWEGLQDTNHFTTVNCCLMDRNSCVSSERFMTICKDEEACGVGGSESHQDHCEVCGLWQCADCGMYGEDLHPCHKCDTRACSDGCVMVELCDSCWERSCNVCGPARLCEGGCGNVRSPWGRKHPVRHYPDCYRDHPAAAAMLKSYKD